jgi:hypothetical protein
VVVAFEVSTDTPTTSAAIIIVVNVIVIQSRKTREQGIKIVVDFTVVAANTATALWRVAVVFLVLMMLALLVLLLFQWIV